MSLSKPLQAAAGNAGAATYIEDVFSTYLYTGNDTYKTITNGIDLAGEGGLVWLKRRDAASSHVLVDTERGAGASLFTNTTGAQQGPSSSGVVNSFNSDGFTLWVDNYGENVSGASEVSWTFRKAPKFFDVVTGTVDSGGNAIVSHALGSVPGFGIIKMTSSVSSWFAYHQSLGTTKYTYLNSTDAAGTWGSGFGWTSTSTQFGCNGWTPGTQFVAYVFAHDAGGFGDDGEQNVISCGSFTTDGSGTATVNLGWEPQWLLIKRTDATNIWQISDVMRGMSVSNSSVYLQPQSSSAESTAAGFINAPTPTGFVASTGYSASATYIYIAIRRGPMKTPESGTEVFAVDIGNSNGSSTTPEFYSGFPTDAALWLARGGDDHSFRSRLTGQAYLATTSTAAESSNSFTKWNFQDGWFNTAISSSFSSAMFRRAPGFFDEVCYPGTFSAKTVNHNLGVAPELIIFKKRNGVERWPVYSASLNANQSLTLSADWSAGNDDVSNNTRPTSTVFSVSGSNEPLVNEAGYNYVAYLFASCPGVSKVGSYTGTGTTQQINCGFTSGARFVLIKRTDSTGDWYVWDSARGIVSGNDPYLLLNSTAAENTSTDYVDPYSAGFEISSTAPAAINASGGTYIYLAIA